MTDHMVREEKKGIIVVVWERVGVYGGKSACFRGSRARFFVDAHQEILRAEKGTRKAHPF